MTVGASRADLTINCQPALAPSPQPRPAPTARALPPKPVARGGQNWTPIGGQIWAPIDSLIAGFAGVGAVGVLPRTVRAQNFKARQYHPQPAASHLHIYLTKLWDAVRIETGGRLDVTVYAQNNGVPIAEPEILKLLQAGELEFFVLNGNILS